MVSNLNWPFYSRVRHLLSTLLAVPICIGLASVSQYQTFPAALLRGPTFHQRKPVYIFVSLKGLISRSPFRGRFFLPVSGGEHTYPCLAI